MKLTGISVGPDIFVVGGLEPLSFDAVQDLSRGWDGMIVTAQNAARAMYMLHLVASGHQPKEMPTKEFWEGMTRSPSAFDEAAQRDMRALTLGSSIDPWPEDYCHPRPLRIAWSTDRHMNAFAGKAGDGYVICINLVLAGYLYKMMSESTKLDGFLADITGSWPRSGRGADFSFLESTIVPGDCQMGQVLTMGLDAFDLKTDARRVILAELLSQIALQGVLAHEIAHILLGHAAYGVRSGNTVAELEGSGFDLRVRQLFEVEADVNAPYFYLGRDLAKMHFGKVSRYFDQLGLPPTTDLFTRLYAVATGITWSLLALLDQERNGMEVHPDPMLRYVTTRDGWAGSFSNINETDGDANYAQAKGVWMQDLDSLLVVMERAAETIPHFRYKKRSANDASEWFAGIQEDLFPYRERWGKYAIWS